MLKKEGGCGSVSVTLSGKRTIVIPAKVVFIVAIILSAGGGIRAGIVADPGLNGEA